MFENIRNGSLRNHVSYPSRYLCVPAQYEKVELERISDDDIYLFFEEGMKSGCFLYI